MAGPYLRITRSQVKKPGEKRVGRSAKIEAVGEDGTVVDISSAVRASNVSIDVDSADRLTLEVLAFEMGEGKYVDLVDVSGHSAAGYSEFVAIGETAA